MKHVCSRNHTKSMKTIAVTMETVTNAAQFSLGLPVNAAKSASVPMK